MDTIVIGYYLYLFATRTIFSESDPFWVFYFWFYLVCIAAALALLFISYTEPGASMVIKELFLEWEEKRDKISLVLECLTPAIIISLFLVFGAFKLLFVYVLFTGLYYLIRHFALNYF